MKEKGCLRSVNEPKNSNTLFLFEKIRRVFSEVKLDNED